MTMEYSYNAEANIVYGTPSGTLTVMEVLAYFQEVFQDEKVAPRFIEVINFNDVEDFAFRVGNDNDPGGWPAATAPESVAVHPDEGINGSDRVVLIWPDGVIQHTWLQVTMLPTLHTGLNTADVFYFGNAIGETGNSTTDAMVTSVDEIAARHNPQVFTLAELANPYDFNRDGRVTAVDQILARHNIHAFDALQLIDLSAPVPALAPLAPPSAVPAARVEEESTAADFTSTDWSFHFDALLSGSEDQDDERPIEEVVDHLLATLPE